MPGAGPAFAGTWGGGSEPGVINVSNDFALTEDSGLDGEILG
jgi:hypothetical protein